MVKPNLRARDLLGLVVVDDVLPPVRIRSRSARPVLQATHSIPREVGRRIRQRDLKMPIDRMLVRAVGVDRVEQVVSAVLASPIVARRLQISLCPAFISVCRTLHHGHEVVGCSELLASAAACQVRRVLDQPPDARA
jgi:DNA-binding GntR family transcriptional regulator